MSNTLLAALETWQLFETASQSDAEELKHLILAICETLRNIAPAYQVAALEIQPAYAQLRNLLNTHRQLGVDVANGTEVLIWIKYICSHLTMQQVRDA